MAREELLRRDAAAAARSRLEEKEIKRLEKAAARYKVWAVKNPDLNKRKNAIETRIARIEAERDPGLFGPRAAARTGRRRDRCQGGAARRRARRSRRPTARASCSRIDRLAVAAGDRVALLGVNGAGKSTLLSALAAAYDPEQEHYDGRRRSASIPAAGWSISTSRCATCRSTTSIARLPGRGRGGDREGRPSGFWRQAGFAFARIREPIGVLSHGERSRLVFLQA